MADELEEWRRSLERELARRTGRKDIEVTVGPYRAYDVSVSHGKDCHPIVDFYSPIRRDYREGRAIEYAVSMIKDWEATLAGYESDKKIAEQFFREIQSEFPDMELKFSVGDFEMHHIELTMKKGKISGSFDLWPGMRPKDVEKVKSEIKRLKAELTEGSTMGINYVREA